MHSGSVFGVVWSPNGEMLASCSDDQTIQIYETTTWGLRWKLEGHSGSVWSVAWSPSGHILASGHENGLIKLWDSAGRSIGVLEGQTASIRSISFSAFSRLLASKSSDGTVQLWNCNNWETVAVLDEPGQRYLLFSLSFHPTLPVLATFGEKDRAIRIWNLDPDILLGAESTPRSVQYIYPKVIASAEAFGTPTIHTVHYANAKIVLVGDRGVGKSALALVLAGQPFVPTESTHGRHIRTFDSQEVEISDGRKEAREILLWDLAGQPGYRLIHQLHLNEVAVALVVFDARSETDPFAGVHHWDRALRQAQHIQSNSAPPMKKFLVAACMDRGGIGVSRARIDSLVHDLGFNRYFETSAKEGWNIAELAEAIRAAIDWDALPKVSSPKLFQLIKAFLIEEKEVGRLLSTADDLYRSFLKSVNAPAETEGLRSQFDICVGRVESRGLIRRLSFGNLILLQPELLDAYASAMVNAAKDEPDGLGSIAEEDARVGRFRMPEDERIKDKEQEKLLLIAMVEDLLRHEIALREPADNGPYLVFPSQFTRENPDLPDPEGKAVIFNFKGPMLNVYATLAVRISHSGVFKRKEMWKNAAAYTAKVGGTCGMFLREIEEGSGELALFFDTAASEETRFQFEEYIHAHLRRRALPESIHRRRIFVCSDCKTLLTDLQARRRRDLGHKIINCPVCSTEISLLDQEERLTVPGPSLVPEMDRAADAQRDLDAGLTSAAAEMKTPSFKNWAGSSRTTLAIVFTDIVGSTALGNKLGNEMMSEIRRAHFKQGQHLIEKHNGYMIKTIGDSLMVGFRTALDALDFTLALYKNTGDNRIRIRAGIHVGAVQIEEEDAFGTVVNYTARVENKAKKAEIWVSDRAIRDIDEEKAEAHRQLRWTKHPNCKLKGFPGKHILWSVEE